MSKYGPITPNNTFSERHYPDNLPEIPSSVFSGSTTSQYTERRKSLVALPPAMADMLRHIAEDMEGGCFSLTLSYDELMRVDANSLRNIAAILDAIAVQSGQMPLPVERRQT